MNPDGVRATAGVADRHPHRRRQRAGRDRRHGGLHGARAGARKACRQARRHLGLRGRPLRDADRAPAPSPARDSPTCSPRSCAGDELDPGASHHARAPATAARTLLERCLTADVKQRLRDIGEARVALAAIERDPVDPAPAAAGRPGRCQRSSMAPAIRLGPRRPRSRDRGGARLADADRRQR